MVAKLLEAAIQLMWPRKTKWPTNMAGLIAWISWPDLAC